MNNKKNIFSRIVIILLMIFISAIIAVSFMLSKNPYIITGEIILCLAILVVLCLSETFDNFSISKIITLSKNIKEVKNENDKLREANLNLITQMINLKNSNNQSLNMYMPNQLYVSGSDNIEDINSKQSENADVKEEEQKPVVEDARFTQHRILRNQRFLYRRKLEIFLMKKAMNNIPDNADKQYDVRLINNKPLEDNIMKRDTRFDAYITYGKNNIFYEIKVQPLFLNFSFELYYKLRLVQLYGEINKNYSKLVLIIPKYDNELNAVMEEENRFVHFLERITSTFEPAINNGLLEILQIEVTKEELDNYMKDENKENTGDSK